MSKLLANFPTPSFDDWQAQLLKDLKGESPSLLEYKNAIEEIDLLSYQHPELTDKLPNFRFITELNNDWRNLANISVQDLSSANKKALEALELGADALRFDCGNNVIDFKVLLAGIQYPFIHTRFVIQTEEQLEGFMHSFSKEEYSFFSLEIDFLKTSISKAKAMEFAQKFAIPTFAVNGYNIQQGGANCSQEIAFCLSTAHAILVDLMNQGKSTYEANQLIHFVVGVGNTYFFEIAKINVLRKTWNSILVNYNAQHDLSQSVQITAMTGFMNKSLEDPYTNLLRQTTEVMSMLAAGVNGIIVQPYDTHSKISTSDLTERMAINIPTILKEESYFHAVQQPLEGSYTLKTVEHALATASWKLFQEFEAMGGISEVKCKEKLIHLIEAKASQRIELMNENKNQFIGINIFPNSDQVNNEWLPFEPYLGIKPLILEQHKTAGK